MSPDKRRTARTPSDHPATWRRGRRLVPCRICELNVHGASLISSEAPDVNFLMEVEVELNGRTVPVMLVTRSVRFVEGRYLAGVEIHSISSDAEVAWLTAYRGGAVGTPRPRSTRVA